MSKRWLRVLGALALAASVGVVSCQVLFGASPVPDPHAPERAVLPTR